MEKTSFPVGSPEEYINRSLYFESKTFLHGLLAVEDKLSMAHGLETRVPFLDNDLVDFAMKVPVRYKLRDYSQIVRINEKIIRNTMFPPIREHDLKQISGVSTTTKTY